MTTTPIHPQARRLERSASDTVVRLLESDFGEGDPAAAVLRHQVLLDALDRGEGTSFYVWPPDDPVAVAYISGAGTLVPAGSPVAGPALAEAAERRGWRVLVGDAPLSRAVLDTYPRGLFRRGPSGREQRFMVATEPPSQPAPDGFRRAVTADLDELTELACLLHVEDRMGPPIARSSRGAVRARMADSVLRGLTYVVERDGSAVAKFDVSLRSRRRGGQIAGVYVDARHRGQALASGAVAGIVRDLLTDGLPGVTLHVRADNAPAIAAYRRAGMADRGPWILALR